MKKTLAIAILASLMASPVYLHVGTAYSQTTEYDFYISPEQTSKAVNIEQIEAQVLKHINFRNEALDYYQHARNPDNKAYWFFEAIKQDALHLLALIRLAHFAYSPRPDATEPDSLQQWRRPEAQKELNGLKRSAEYVRGLLAKAGEDTKQMLLIDQNLGNLLKAVDQSKKVKERTHQADIQKRSYFQQLAGEYLRIRYQFNQFISMEDWS